MPLVQLDALPKGQVVVNTDDIVLIHHNGANVEIVLRGTEWRVLLPHASVADVAADLDQVDNLVLRNVIPT